MRSDMSDLAFRVDSLQKRFSAADPLVDITPVDQAHYIMRHWDETAHVTEVILVLLGLADHLGRERVSDWDSEKAMSLAKSYMADFDVADIESDILWTDE
jgi:hypothetical protein